ncbi:MAG: hypothetical protein Q9195_008476 [Heterodermia aff. obscurata]
MGKLRRGRAQNHPAELQAFDCAVAGHTLVTSTHRLGSRVRGHHIALWGTFHYEIRVLNFSLPEGHKQDPKEYWKEQEEKISKILGTVRHTMTSFSSIGSLPPATAELGFLGLVGGWVVAEDGSQEGPVNTETRRWIGILDGKMRPVSGKRGVKIIQGQGKNACSYWCQVQMGLDNDGTP